MIILLVIEYVLLYYDICSGEQGGNVKEQIMLSALTISALLATGTPPEGAQKTRWNVHGFENGKPVASLQTDPIMASTRVNNGPAIVLLCSSKAGLQTVFVYEPSEVLEEQVFLTQSFLRRKSGTITIDDTTLEDAWLWKRRHGTLQARTRSTGVALLNAAFSGKPVTFSFDGMEEIKVTFPEADENLMEFVGICPTTRVRSDKAT